MLSEGEQEGNPMRIMRDSVTARDIPVNTKMVGGYVTGPYRWSAADWGRFPNARHVQIDTQASPPNIGHVLDVETGDATPEQAPGWCTERLRTGQVPTIYCNMDTWPLVIRAVNRAGIAHPNYFIAEYDNVDSLPSIKVDGRTYHAIAKQYQWDRHPAYSGGHFDQSVVADYWPGVDPTPKPTPAGGGAKGDPVNADDARTLWAYHRTGEQNDASQLLFDAAHDARAALNGASALAAQLTALSAKVDQVSAKLDALTTKIK